MKKIKKSFIKLLKEIANHKVNNFSGLGLVLYNSKFFLNIPCISLRPSFESPTNISINSTKEAINFLLKVSQNSHPLHDGFHFFNEKGQLTHVSQYLAAPIVSGVIPHELHGSRYLTALCASHIKGVIATGIITQDYNTFYFEEGKSYNLMSQWENIYKKGGKDYKYYDVMKPHEDIDKIIKIFKEKGVKRILDLGCGIGRNLLCLAQQGFEVYGIDMSEEGIKFTKESLKKRGLKANLRIGNIFEKLPYPDNFFDAVVSVQVLQHGSLNQIRKAIAEIERVLKPKDLLFVTLCGRYSKGKVRYCLVKTAKKIAPRTYVPTIGDEMGLIHYIYNKQILKKHYKNFKIIDLWKDSNGYYCLLGVNKKNSYDKSDNF